MHHNRNAGDHVRIVSNYIMENKLLNRIDALEKENKQKDKTIENLLDELAALKTSMNYVLQFIKEVQDVETEVNTPRNTVPPTPQQTSPRPRSRMQSEDEIQIYVTPDPSDTDNNGRVLKNRFPTDMKEEEEEHEEEVEEEEVDDEFLDYLILKNKDVYIENPYITEFDDTFRGKKIEVVSDNKLAKLNNNKDLVEQSVRFKYPLNNENINVIRMKFYYNDHAQTSYPEFYIGCASSMQSKFDYNQLIDTWKSFHGIYCNSKVFKAMEWGNFLLKDFEYRSNDEIGIVYDFTDLNEKKLYFFKNGIVLNKSEPLILPNDNKLHKEWFPVVSMCSLGTHTFAILDD